VQHRHLQRQRVVRRRPGCAGPPRRRTPASARACRSAPGCAAGARGRPAPAAPGPSRTGHPGSCTRATCTGSSEASTASASCCPARSSRASFASVLAGDLLVRVNSGSPMPAKRTPSTTY
jgi:hypothetical protein